MENVKKKYIEKSFIEDGARVYETIYSKELSTSGYFYFDRLSGESGFVAELTIGELIYRPPQNNLASNGIMLFPERADNYGSFLDLLENVRSFINKYLELPDDYQLIASCYVILSWVYDCFDTIPYLRARGDYGTGKSRFLKVIGSVCYRSLFAGGSSTTSPIFRLIDAYSGLTLVLDEADFRFSGPDAEIIKILNTGYEKGCGVLRTEGDKVRVATSYATFGPKILATRKEFEDQALESRCLTNYMTGMTRKDIPHNIPKIFYHESQMIRNQLLKFRIDNHKPYEIDSSFAVEGVEPRVNQILLPLFTLVESEDIREELRKFARKHALVQAQIRADTLEADVLNSILILSSGGPTISLKSIAAKVNEERDKGQGEYMISPAKIGRVNKTSFGFTTRTINGRAEILWDKERADRLCIRYNIPQLVGDVGFVGLFDQSMESVASSGIPEEAIF